MSVQARKYSDKKSIQIYVSSHIPDMCGDYPLHKWIYCGRAAEIRTDELNDITIQNPRLENRRWSELSAAYKIWKEGPRTEIIGMCHYRRFFDFHSDSNELTKSVKRGDLISHISDDIESMILSTIDDKTIITPKFYNLKTTVAINYARRHDLIDYIRGSFRCMTIFPHLAPSIASQILARKLYPFNIFIMNWNDFDELCHVWFDSLIDLSKQTPWPRKDPYQDRDMAFVAERLTDAWLRYKRSSGYRIVQYPLYFVSD